MECPETFHEMWSLPKLLLHISGDERKLSRVSFAYNRILHISDLHITGLKIKNLLTFGFGFLKSLLISDLHISGGDSISQKQKAVNCGMCEKYWDDEQNFSYFSHILAVHSTFSILACNFSSALPPFLPWFAREVDDHKDVSETRSVWWNSLEQRLEFLTRNKTKDGKLEKLIE